MEKFDNKTFLEVWDRVTEKPKPIKSGEQSDREKLCFFMDRAAFCIAFYTALAQKSRRENAEIFRKLALSVKEDMSELMSAYFVLTGDTYTPERVKPYFSSVLDGVRDMYLAEKAEKEAYHRSAMETENGSITDLCHRLASMCEKRADKLMEIIKKALR